MKTAEEMTAYGRREKPTAGFPPRPQALEIVVRFPHSLSCGEAWESGKHKAVSHFPTRCLLFPELKDQNQYKEARSAQLRSRFRLILRLENAVTTALVTGSRSVFR